MDTRKDYFVEQNIGVIERCVRVVIGFVMLGYPYYLMQTQGITIEYWQAILMLLSPYPALTGIVGTDPLYAWMKVKTCDLSNRNQCGSFPYQVDALLGHDPKPETDLEHTLVHAHHKKHA